ncbi:hypothetical protein C8Q76DRAFT_407405 [Earliella scabrosa]|nr:hypothetical protein C8Q76DRAFT_407405 [Earliella scabrosa]
MSLRSLVGNPGRVYPPLYLVDISGRASIVLCHDFAVLERSLAPSFLPRNRQILRLLPSPDPTSQSFSPTHSIPGTCMVPSTNRASPRSLQQQRPSLCTRSLQVTTRRTSIQPQPVTSWYDGLEDAKFRRVSFRLSEFLLQWRMTLTLGRVADLRLMPAYR